MSARARAARESWTGGLLVVALVAGLLALAGGTRARLDLTEEGLYTLDPATVGLLRRLEDRLQVKLYFNRELEGAEAMLPQRLLIEDFLGEIAAAARGRVRVETVDPTTDLVAQRDAEHAGIQPLQIATGDLSGAGVVLAYQGLELRYLDRSEVIPFTVPAELEFAFASRLSSLLQPRRPEIAFHSREPALPPPLPGIPGRVPPERIYQELRALWSARAAVRDVDLTDPDWRGEATAALVVARPDGLEEAEVAALDRYLAEGGRVLVLADGENVDPNAFTARPLRTGLEDWLAGIGLRVQPNLLWDESCLQITVGHETVQTQVRREPVPIQRPYGFFPVLRNEGLARTHVATATLDGLTLFWAHPIETRALAAGLAAEALLQSSDRSWVLPADTPIERSQEALQRIAEFARQSGPGRPHPLALAVRGAFPPQREHADLRPAPGLLVLVGDSDLFHNVVLNNRSAGGANAVLAANLADWLTGDESLIGLRSRGRTAREIVDFRAAYLESQGGWALTDEENRALEREMSAHARSRERWIAWGNVLGPPALAGALALLARRARRRRAETDEPGAAAA